MITKGFPKHSFDGSTNNEYNKYFKPVSNYKNLNVGISSTGTSSSTPMYVGEHDNFSIKVDNKTIFSVEPNMPKRIVKVIFNGPATILFFEDRTKTPVKLASDLDYHIFDDREAAMMYAVLKRYRGSEWKKEMERYHYALECNIPRDVMDEYMTDLDNAYLRLMVERIDKEYGTDFMVQINDYSWLRWFNDQYLEGGRCVVVTEEEMLNIHNDPDLW